MKLKDRFEFRLLSWRGQTYTAQFDVCANGYMVTWPGMAVDPAFYPPQIAADYVSSGKWLLLDESSKWPTATITNEKIEAETIQVSEKTSFEERAQALLDKGVTITLRPDGFIVFKDGQSILEVSPVSGDWDSGLDRAEKVFGN